MRLLAPTLFAVLLFVMGRRLGGMPVGLLLGLVGAAVAYNVGGILRKRTLRKAPDAPVLEPGEVARLHGPVSVQQAQGAQECWAYLSDRRLSLLPTDGARGVELRLSELSEIRPLERKLLGGGGLALVAPSGTWRLQVPSRERWLQALRSGTRG